MNEFKHRLQHLAALKKIEQADLARALSKDTSTISKWWNGEMIPGPKNTRLISEYFGCDYDWLKTGTGEPYPQPTTDTAENKGVFTEKRKTKDIDEKLARIERAVFKQQCSGYFDDFFDFIGENYGESREDVTQFLDELYKSHGNYRDWIREKKRVNEGIQNSAQGNIVVNDK